MSTIEERLRTYAAELETEADLAEARRPATPDGAEHPTFTRRTMRPWQRLAIAAVTVAILGTGLWLITGRSSDSPVGTTPITAPTVTVAGSAAPWYRVTAPGFAAQAIAQETCCAEYDVPGPPTVVSWQASGGPSHGLLVLTVYSAQEGGAVSGLPGATLKPQPDGSVWQFLSYGLSVARREALAAKVIPGSGLPYVLPDDSMSLLSIGGLGPAAHTKVQTYLATGADDPGVAFATIDVGSDRGLFRGIASASSVTDTTVAGMPAYRSELSDGTITFDWRSTAGRWAALSIGSALAKRADEIAASVVPDQSELLPPGMDGELATTPSTPSTTFADQARTTLATLGWTATFEESQTRTTAEGVEVQWAYFGDGDRRLFLVSGPPDLLDGVPELKRHLTATSDPSSATATFVWPRELSLYTAAMSNSTRTVIIRSEGIDPTDAARPSADMDALLQAVALWP